VEFFDRREAGMRAIVVLAVIALVGAWPASAAGPSSKLAALERQNGALTQKVAKLTQALNSANSQLTTAQDAVAAALNLEQTYKAQVAADQQGVAATIASMSPVDIWNSVFPPMIKIFNANGPTFQVSTFDQGDYKTVEIDYCGFC
jgi:hypothetical protein